MKGKITVLALTALLLLGMNVSAQAANSFNYLGETTWSVTISESYPNQPPPMSITMTGAISKLGGTYYLFQGVVQVPDDNPFFLSGGGTLVGGKLVLTLNTSQKHTDSGGWSNRDSGVMHVELDQATLSGSFYEVGHDYDRVSSDFAQRFTAGTVNRTGPFIPLNMTTAPLIQLLLE